MVGFVVEYQQIAMELHRVDPLEIPKSDTYSPFPFILNLSDPSSDRYGILLTVDRLLANFKICLQVLTEYISLQHGFEYRSFVVSSPRMPVIVGNVG